MKAVVQDRYGSAEVLRVEEVDVPVPDATSVLLKVRSASVNALDWRILSGTPRFGRFLFGISRPKRRIRGVDVSGEVAAVRKPDSRFKVGDAVFGLGSGSFAEWVAADESEITAKPDGVPFDDAATLGVAAFTALQGLRDLAQLRVGQSVAVLGAGSGVGTFAVQIARWMGGRVTAVSSADNAEMLRSIGAHVVVDRDREDFARRPERFDVIFDVSGRYSMGRLIRLLEPQGRLVIVGARGGFGRFIHASMRRRVLRQRVRVLLAKARVADLELLGELAAQGKIKPVIEHVYSLGEAPAAFARAGRHQASGKLVIRVA